MTNQRFHDMDFCRAVFMYCGILFHCGLIYGAGQDWRVVSDQTSSILSLLSNFLHHFRMEAFYLVSGFFFLLIFEKGRSNFLNERILRALIPMLVVGFTLNFAMNMLSNNRSYELGLDYFISGKWQAHLWFLGNLIIYFIVAYPLVKKQNSKSKEKIKINLSSAMIMLLLFALVGHLVAKHWSFTTVVFVNFGYLFYYFAFFLMGVFAYQQTDEFYSLIDIKKLPTYLLVYVSLQAIVKLNPGWDGELQHIIKQISHFPLMLAAFSFLCFIGQKQNKYIRFLSDASYTIYLFHQPLLIVLYVFIFAHLQLGAVTEYILLITMVFVISSAIHVYLVQRYDLAKLLLNGVLPSKKVHLTKVRTKHLVMPYTKHKQG